MRSGTDISEFSFPRPPPSNPQLPCPLSKDLTADFQPDAIFEKGGAMRAGPLRVDDKSRGGAGDSPRPIISGMERIHAGSSTVERWK